MHIKKDKFIYIYITIFISLMYIISYHIILKNIETYHYNNALFISMESGSFKSYQNVKFNDLIKEFENTNFMKNLSYILTNDVEDIKIVDLSKNLDILNDFALFSGMTKSDEPFFILILEVKEMDKNIEKVDLIMEEVYHNYFYYNKNTLSTILGDYAIFIMQLNPETDKTDFIIAVYDNFKKALFKK